MIEKVLLRVIKMKIESESEVSQSCPTFCDPMDCRLPGSSIHGILQANILEWAAISFSRGSSWPRDQTQVSCIVGGCFNLWATREAIFELKKKKRKKENNTELQRLLIKNNGFS